MNPCKSLGCASGGRPRKREDVLQDAGEALIEAVSESPFANPSTPLVLSVLGVVAPASAGRAAFDRRQLRADLNDPLGPFPGPEPTTTQQRESGQIGAVSGKRHRPCGRGLVEPSQENRTLDLFITSSAHDVHRDPRARLPCLAVGLTMRRCLIRSGFRLANCEHAARRLPCACTVQNQSRQRLQDRQGIYWICR